MKRLVAIVFLGLAMSVALAGPDQPWAPTPFILRAQAVKRYSSTCQPGRPAQVVVSGDGAAPLLVYVFDAAGNCVAWDDESIGSWSDDRVVPFVPTSRGPYEIEIRNGGVLSITVGDTRFKVPGQYAGGPKQEVP